MSYDDDWVILDNSLNLANALAFISLLPNDIPEPYLNYSPYCYEVNVEWYIDKSKQVTVSFYAEDEDFTSEDGIGGYCYKGVKYFEPGKHILDLSAGIPKDLLNYLRNM